MILQIASGHPCSISFRLHIIRAVISHQVYSSTGTQYFTLSPAVLFIIYNLSDQIHNNVLSASSLNHTHLWQALTHKTSQRNQVFSA